MSDYKAPVNEIKFVRNEVLDFPKHYASLPGFDEATPDLESAILEEAAKLAENVIAPLNKIGDEQGCTLKDGIVTTPEGFKEAYQQYVEGGWPSLAAPEQWGGQNLPASMETMVTELFGQANHAWAMYPGLASGAKATIIEHGSDEQQANYLPKLISGEWLATMCLTEPHCGSDLGLLKTKAEMQTDGTYKVTGTKIFISSGDHDMSDNIIHIVLARLPDAPAGTKGISLFIIPKFTLDENGNPGERNAVNCGSLEHKMGIHGNNTRWESTVTPHAF
jgi:alkylation response protein AidB-like acyl-CoA dehydrogenase